MANGSNQVKLQSYPPDLFDDSVHPANIQFRFYERKNPNESEYKDLVSLYMPETVEQPSTINWGTANLGFVGNAIAKAGNGAMDMFTDGFDLKGAMDAGGDVLAGGAALLGARALANVGSIAVGLMGGNATAEDLMGAVGGKIPNPYLTAVFRGIDFRQFAFSFKFYPFSESDCQRIYDIIQTFRSHALPSYAGDEGGIKSLLNYPSECGITYMWRGKRNPWIHRFKRAVCTGIDVDYTGQGMFTTMRNGFPSEITMSTKWTEIEIVTREDVGPGDNQGY